MFKRNKTKPDKKLFTSMAFFNLPTNPIEPIRDMINISILFITNLQFHWQPKKLKSLVKENKQLKRDILQIQNAASILKLAYYYNCFWHVPIALPKKKYESYEPRKIYTLPRNLKIICMLLGIGGLGYTAYNNYNYHYKTNIFQIHQPIPTSTLFRRFSTLTPSIAMLGMALLASVADGIQRTRQYQNIQEQQNFELKQKYEYYENLEKSLMAAYKKSWKYPEFFQSYSIEPPQPISQNQTSEIETQDSKNDLTTELILDGYLDIFDTINLRK